MKSLAVVVLLALSALRTLASQANPRTGTHVEGIVGYHFGTPAKASAALGLSLAFPREVGRWKDSTWIASWRRTQHVFLIAEPGINGARVSTGYGVQRRTPNAQSLVTGRLSAYRRWHRDRGDPGGTFVGVEASAGTMADIAVGLRLGIFRRISGAGKQTLLAIDLPFGW